MEKPDIPQDEGVRLETLRSLNILDTPPEERFDRLTRMAKRLFRVPIAVVSLVDERRQWFKSCVGLSVRETPRDVSFCGHAILGDEIFVIPDAAQDVRFADNPLVLKDPRIRFYAGCPLRSLDGSKVGTLCIIDREPRRLSGEDLEILKDLASTVEREIAAVELATLDELTNVTNRRGFMLLGQYSLSICARQGIPASLVFLDLNNFKAINDKFGHGEGDKALTAFANQMKSVVRHSDLIARLGGDEFVVLLADTTTKAADDIIARFRKLLAAYNRDANSGYDISFSYGVVAFSPDKHHSVEALLTDGDAVMYKRKKQRNKVTA